MGLGALKAKIVKYGLRNILLTAQMPTATTKFDENTIRLYYMTPIQMTPLEYKGHAHPSKYLPLPADKPMEYNLWSALGNTSVLDFHGTFNSLSNVINYIVEDQTPIFAKTREEILERCISPKTPYVYELIGDGYGNCLHYKVTINDAHETCGAA